MKVRNSSPRIALLSLLLAVVSTSTAAASPTLECTGTQSFNNSEITIIACTGSLTISGGELISDRSISISATQSITLNDLVLTAPSIYITGEPINLSQTVTLNSQYLRLNSPDVLPPTTPSIIEAINLGEAAYINTNIPEPSSAALLGLGLVLLASFRRYQNGSRA